MTSANYLEKPPQGGFSLVVFTALIEGNSGFWKNSIYKTKAKI
jgi:hypothetical protein